MGLNIQTNEKNAEIMLDSEGEPIDPNSKKNPSRKFLAVILVVVVLIISGSIYYILFLNNKDNRKSPSQEDTKIAKNEEVKKDEADKKLDTDQDGLPDYMEKIFGTDPGKVDTDGDGYGDLAEIKNGYNPLTDEKYSVEEWNAIKKKIKMADKNFYEQIYIAEKEEEITTNSIQNPLSFVCGDATVADIDNNIYNTVKIGGQCWLKENLRVTKNPAGESITRYCYDDDVSICDADGGLYDWNTAMNNFTQEGAQGICPNGWHIPKDSDLYILENYLTDSKIKDADPRTIISDDDGCIYDRGGKGCYSAAPKFLIGGSSGFDAVLTGNRTIKSAYDYRKDSTDFWSSTEKDKDNSWLRQINRDFPWVMRSYDLKSFGFSVRCIKD